MVLEDGSERSAGKRECDYPDKHDENANDPLLSIGARDIAVANCGDSSERVVHGSQILIDITHFHILNIARTTHHPRAFIISS